MKRIFAALLAALLMLSMCAYAEWYSEEKNCTENKSIEFQIFNTSVMFEAPVHSVDIMWEELKFTYSGFQQREWDPTTHTYSEPEGTAPQWDNTSCAIGFSSHSNVDLEITFEINQGIANNHGVSLNMRNDKIDLKRAAENSDPADAPVITTALEVTGTPTAVITEKGITGTILIIISEKETQTTNPEDGGDDELPDADDGGEEDQ